MKQKLDPKKFTRQTEEIQKAAKTELIELLKNNPKGRYIWFSGDDVDELEGCVDSFSFHNDYCVAYFSSIGLDDDDTLVFLPDDGDKWLPIADYAQEDYASYYEFAVKYYDFAKPDKDPEDGESWNEEDFDPDKVVWSLCKN